MRNINKIIFVIISLVLFSGCTPKLTIKALQPAKITSDKINNIHVETFENDFINQTIAVEDKIINKTIDNKKVFNITDNSDVVLTGKVLQSSLEYNIYYEQKINYNKCRVFRVEGKEKKKTCLEYYTQLIPCEDREYYVSTKVRVLKQSTKSILFTKTYEESRNIRQCFDYYYYPYHSFSRNKKEINKQLARKIANSLIDDISPHYRYFELEVIDSFNSKHLNINKEQEEKLKEIAKLIENNKLITAKELLEKMNTQFKGKSWEVLYNLGLIQEGLNNFYNANIYYKKSKLNIKEIDDLVLINTSISRVTKNLEEKIKAKSQLP